MNLNDVRHLLIAQSVEESDPKATVLPESERDLASSAAGAPLVESASENEQCGFLIRRSKRLVRFLEPRQEAIAEVTKTAPFNRFRLFAFVVIAVAVVAGFLTNELGPEKRINILAFPLLGILVWNLFVYAREFIGIFKKPKFEIDGLDRWLTKIPTAAADFDEKDKTPVEVRQSLALFRKNWMKVLIPIVSAKGKSLLHFGAAVVAAAAIGGMYVKGLANEYTAIWESTFFTAETLHPFLKVVLGSASAISGIGLPDLEGLRAIGGVNSTGESAAGWIHLYAITMGVFVIVPRIVLAVIWQGRSRVREKTVPFRSFAPAYFDRLLAVSMGDALKISVLPYAHNPSGKIRNRIQKQAEDMIGGAVKLEWLDAISFGAEEEPIAFEKWPTDLIVAFNFASTPEKETHGELLKNIGQLAREAGGTTHCHLFLDAESFDRKADSFSDFEQRRGTRLAGWENLASADFKDALHVISAD